MMFIILKRNWIVPDGIIPAGRYEIERIDNPHGFKAPWLVLKGTRLGASEGSWRQWEGKEYDEFEVIIEETDEEKINYKIT